MAGASTYTQNNVLKSLLRGTAYPLPAGTYISLHTADPGVTGLNEATVGAWPAYVRRHAEVGGTISTGWSLPTAGISANLLQVTFPSHNGAGPLTITHFAIWDALSGGNCLESAALTVPRTLQVGDILIFDVGSLTVTVT